MEIFSSPPTKANSVELHGRDLETYANDKQDKDVYEEATAMQGSYLLKVIYNRKAQRRLHRSV